ncbi:MAG: hypothetical protein SFU25_04420, partial [Candidatus Caenarcaniphilales bacterium]|nr:hypothetical protein [Candidatus Caenarcaniphilales bacterium]
MNLLNPQSNLDFVKLNDNPTLSQRVQLFFKLLLERVKVCFQTKRVEDVTLTFSLLWEYLNQNFSAKEKKDFVIRSIIAVVLFSLILEFTTHGQINKALENHQSAKAEEMIKQRLMFMPWDNGLKLRLAHAYMSLGRENEAKSIIDEVQSFDSGNAYLPKVALDLARTLKRQNKSFQAISILEKIPVHSCKECVTELLNLYTIEGRRSLLDRNMERATHFLSRGLKLAIKTKETPSSINHRKRELAKAYNLQADNLIKASEFNRAITLLEESNSIFPMGSTYNLLGQQYETRNTGLGDLRKAIDAYRNAYSFGITDAEISFNKTISKLKAALKKEGLPKKKIDEEIEKYKLTSVEENSSQPSFGGNEESETKTKPKVEEEKESLEKPVSVQKEKPKTELKPEAEKSQQEPILDEPSRGSNILITNTNVNSG